MKVKCVITERGYAFVFEFQGYYRVVEEGELHGFTRDYKPREFVEYMIRIQQDNVPAIKIHLPPRTTMENRIKDFIINYPKRVIMDLTWNEEKSHLIQSHRWGPYGITIRYTLGHENNTISKAYLSHDLECPREYYKPDGTWVDTQAQYLATEYLLRQGKTCPS